MPHTIAKFGRYKLEHPDFPDMVISVTEVPPGLLAGDPIREQFDDRSIDVGHSLGAIWFNVVDSSGAHVATATFAGDGLAAQCDTIDVESAYRRKRVASLLYLIASKIFAAPVVPSSNRSDDALAFWGDQTEISA